MAQIHGPILRLATGSKLSYQQLDNNLNSFYYSSSLNGSQITFFQGTDSGSFTAHSTTYDVNAFTASHAISASYAMSSSVEITLEHSSSYAQSASYSDNSNTALSASYFAEGIITASAANNVITFTKDDNSNFAVTINTGSQSADYIYSATFGGQNLVFNGSGSAFDGSVDISSVVTPALVVAGLRNSVSIISSSKSTIRTNIGAGIIISGSKPSGSILTLHTTDGPNFDFEVGGEPLPDGLLSSSAQIAEDISGSGNVRFEALNSATSSYALIADISGSGNVRFEALNAATSSYALKTEVSGSGDVRFEALNSITGSLIKNAALSGSTTNTITFTKQDDSTIDVTIATSSISIDGLLSSSAQIAEDISGSGNVRFEALNSATSSYALKTDISGSGDVRFEALNAATSSYALIADISGSGNVRFEALNAATSSYALKTDISGSGNIRFEALNIETGSLKTRLSNAEATGSSVPGLLAITGSILNATSSYYNSSSVALNTLKLFNGASTHTLIIHTGSGEPLPDGLLSSSAQIAEDISGSGNVRFEALNSATSSYALKTDISGSGNVRFEALNAATSSYATKLGMKLVSGSGIINAALSGSTTNTIRFTQQESGSFIDITINTGSDTNTNNYLTGLSLNAGSGVLTATRYGLGNVTVDLPIGTDDSPTFAGLTVNGDITANKITTNIVTSSIAFTSGSNKFGDEITDKHMFSGSVHISGGLDLGGGYARGNDITGAFWDGYVISASKVDLSGYVDTNGTPVDNDYAKFTDANTVEGRSYAEVRSDLGLDGTIVSASVLSSPSQGTVRLATNGVNTDVDTGLQTSDDPTFGNLYLVDSAPTLYLRSNRTEVVNNTILGEIKFLTMDDSLSVTSNLGTIKVVSTSTYTGSNIQTDDYKIEIIGNLDLDRIASGSWHGDVIASDKVTHRTVSVDTDGDGSANETLGQSETLMLKKGSNITLTESAGVVTIEAAGTAATDLSKTVSGTGFSVNSSTGDNVALSLADTDNWGLMSDEMFDKLAGIETSADVTDATNVTAAGALMDSELTDLAGVKGVTISTLQVKPSEGAFANGDKTKLDGIESSADVTDATNVKANLPGGVPSGSASQARSQIGAGTVDTSGTPVSQQIAIFTDANTISGSTNFQMHVNGGYPQFNGVQIGDGGTSNLYLGNPISPSSADKGARFHSDNNDFYFDFQGDATQHFYFRDYDGIGGIYDRFTFDFINSDFATGTGTFSGNVTANNFITTSDRKLKKDIEPIKEGLETLKKFVSYEYELDGKKDAGFIAQEVQESLPYAVHTKKDGYLALDTKPIIAHIHKAILEIDQRLSAIEEKLK